MFYNVPTLIIIDKNIEGFKNKFAKNFNRLKKIGIIHLDSSSLANFLNKNFNKVEDWWKSDQVQSLVKSFKKEYVSRSDNPINDLAKILEKK